MNGDLLKVETGLESLLTRLSYMGMQTPRRIRQLISVLSSGPLEPLPASAPWRWPSAGWDFGPGHDRILEVARTVADHDASATVSAKYVAEAGQYRRSRSQITGADRFSLS